MTKKCQEVSSQFKSNMTFQPNQPYSALPNYEGNPPLLSNVQTENSNQEGSFSSSFFEKHSE